MSQQYDPIELENPSVPIGCDQTKDYFGALYDRCIRPHFLGLRMKGACEEKWRKPYLSNEASMLLVGAGFHSRLWRAVWPFVR